MRIGIDDTDSPAGMCTTYLGACLIRRLAAAGIIVTDASLIRLNPNVRYKTRGNAAICLEAEGDPDLAFGLACKIIEALADLSHEGTHPGLVVVDNPPDRAFYRRAVRDFCTTDEARISLDASEARYRGWKLGRGLIGATAAVCAGTDDVTYELLAYRHHTDRDLRKVDRDSVVLAEKMTFPHTWDSVDHENGVVVCVPHTPDPVLFGIRGESPGWVRAARSHIRSQTPFLEQVYRTNQGTDVHLLRGKIGLLLEGRSYMVRGSVADLPMTGRGGHVSVIIGNESETLRCMAYEPTKGFRSVIRQLIPGDVVAAAGSYKGGSLNLEKICIKALAEHVETRPPVCGVCNSRMTSAGKGKGYKCRICSARTPEAERRTIPRSIAPGWYEVPPTARRHLAKPLVRGCPDLI
jgi:tRNA(Ile2)-agmatinylcytidine synthase